MGQKGSAQSAVCSQVLARVVWLISSLTVMSMLASMFSANRGMHRVAVRGCAGHDYFSEREN